MNRIWFPEAPLLTARGWWFLVPAILIAGLGTVAVAYYSATVPLLGLTLLAWFLFEWGLFAARYRSAAGRIAVARQMIQGGRVVPAAWAGSLVTVRVTVTLTGGYRLPFVVLRDRPPTDVPVTEGSPERAVALTPGTPAVIEYTLQPAAAGVLRFEGVGFRTADLSGFFYRRTFLRAAAEVLVIPPLTDDEGQRRGAKRFNTLPPPGVHRLRRPGTGSELLDLREYRPGDPLKMIAWKASARRDRLITKEFESDVPVRCVLFLDASEGARLGPPGGTAAARLAGVAAGVAQAAAASRDLVGLAAFDEAGADFLAPARTHAHQVRLVRAIAEAAGRPARGTALDPLRLARHAHPFAAEVYPDLLERDINSRPLGLFWIPIADTRLMWVVGGLIALPLLMAKVEVADLVARAAAAVAPRGKGWQVLLAFLVLPGALAFLIWLLHGARGFFAPRRRHTDRRKQLAALYAVQDGTGPAGVERYLNDDGAFADRTNRFLTDHRLPPPTDLYGADGRPRYRGAEKVPVLAGAITRAVARARDNELYVLLADLTELAEELGPLVAAARVARARHHQVLVLVPWPADIPPPNRAEAMSAKGLRLGAVVRAGLARRHHRHYARLRVEMAKAGAQVVRVDDGDPVRLVLERLDRLRGTRVR